MYKIDVIISTRNRYNKLIDTIDSIPGNTAGVEICIRIACDGDHVTHKKLLANRENYNGKLTRIVYYAGHNGNVYCRNDLIKECEDAIIYATDDIVFMPGSILKAIEDFRDHFQDKDGVIGFTQTGNRKFCPSGVGLVSKKFLERYPDRQLFCPKYFHFAAQEIHRAAVKLNKFYLSTATIDHRNPFIRNQYMDQTHYDGRIKKDQDHKLSSDRQAKGLTWGING